MRSSTMDLAAHGGIDFFLLSDPNLTQLRLGVKGKVMAGPIIIVFDPALLIGLNNRDIGNKEAINIPARFGFMATPQLNLGLSIALGGPLDGFGDSYRVPLGIGGAFAINSQLDVRAQFAFDNLLGKVEGRRGSCGCAHALDRRRLPHVAAPSVKRPRAALRQRGVFLWAAMNSLDPVGDLEAARAQRQHRDAEARGGEQEVQPRHPDAG